jgi:hypothetical protein
MVNEDQAPVSYQRGKDKDIPIEFKMENPVQRLIDHQFKVLVRNE